ncbi:MAG: hypothetical protein ABSG65_29700 [Bryobacteraceae bacterium]|jgi:hypothetical protein
MIRQVLTSFAFVALSVASAATFKVSFAEPPVVRGKALKAGDYRLDVKENSVVIVKNNKEQVEVPAKIEDVHRRFDQTRVLYTENNGKFFIHEIELGGTTTKLTFDNPAQPHGAE